MKAPPNFFDSHSHIYFSNFDTDREEVIRKMGEIGVWTISVGTDFQNSQMAVGLAEKYDGFFACIGVHPADDKRIEFNENEFETLVSHPKVVAIGECGLDYYRLDPGDEAEKKRQREIFERQIQFAVKYGKPLMIHARSAYDELSDILSVYKKKNQSLTGNMHFFSGNWQQAKKFLDLEFTLSFAGPITFARDYDDVIKNCPISSILAETDSPYASPAPFRGKRNEPSYVAEVVKKIAEIRGEEFERVRETLVFNTVKMFDIKLEKS